MSVKQINRQREHLPWFAIEWGLLKAQLDAKRLPHALMFCGLKGIGKRSLSYSFAARLLCHEDIDVACGTCKSCLLLEAGTHPDLKLIIPEEEGKQVKVDQIRALVDFVAKTPQLGHRKVIVLYPVEDMNINASNALLKSLEEPSADTLLLLVSDAPNRVLPTIRSRCQVVRCVVPPLEQVSPWLVSTLRQDLACGDLAAAYEDEELVRILDIAGGRPLQALSMIEGGMVDARARLIGDLDDLLSNRASAMTMALKWAKDDVPSMLYWLAQLLEDLVRWFAVPCASVLRDKALAPLAERCAQLASQQGLFELLEAVNQARNGLSRGLNPNKQLLLETLFYQMSRWSQGLRAPKPQI
jgi:DNA polymerase-3 subunit delta'